MPLSHEHVGPKILAKIKIYDLTRAELLCSLCYEIPLYKIKFDFLFWIVPLSQSRHLLLLIFHKKKEVSDDFETIFVKTGLSFVAAQLVGKSFTVKQSVFCHQFCHSKISRARPHKGHANKAYLFLKYIFFDIQSHREHSRNITFLYVFRKIQANTIYLLQKKCDKLYDS